QFQAGGLKCFGPNRAAAQLEGSKAFMKSFLSRHNIPTARYESFTELDSALDYIREHELPVVVKADGLAAGKGVTVAQTTEEAITAATAMMADKAFGDAGQRVVVESFLPGEEASFICIVDGKHVLPMATSQDHKARDDGDKGPNTGGLGAYSPAPVVTPEVNERIMQQVILPTISGLAAEGHPFVGFLYAGLMIDPQGQPHVVEFNCRFGDPEAQPVLMRLKTNLTELCEAAMSGRLDEVEAEWDERAALGVVLAAGGYPSSYAKGMEITGIPAEDDSGKVFHAGTAFKDGQLVTNGGRVLCACALGDSIRNAQAAAYQLAEKIHWQDVYYRKDIGHRAVD
ncbi:MAG: phosphoribosylamine--glycine ligase, partial [Pseudomonadota bacterium]